MANYSSAGKAVTIAMWAGCGVLAAPFAIAIEDEPWAGSADRPDTSAEETARIGPGVSEALRETVSVSVVIMLVTPESLAEDHADPVDLRREVARIQNEVLADLDPVEFRVAARYASVPAFSGLLTSAGLAQLKSDPRLLRVDLDTGGSGAPTITW